MGMNKVITQQIREVMESKAISQGELSRRTGIGRPNITRMLSGRSGKIPESWQTVFDELGLELIAVPKGTDASKFFKRVK
jgi:transcriptional regulator with XRE-family HTH domain